MTAPASPSLSESDSQAGQALAASRKIIMNRLMIAVLIAAICALWTAPIFIAAWFAAITAYEVLVTYALREYVMRHMPMAAPATRAISVASVVSGTILYLIPPSAAWVIGGQAASFVAAVFVCITLMNAMTFYANDRLLFVAAAAPGVIAAIGVSLYVAGSFQAALPMIMGICLMLAVTGFAIRDRRTLIERSVRYRVQAADADRASGAKTEFLATMSHELRTPLNAVIGYSEILQEDFAAGRPANPRDAERITAAARTLLGLINDVLDLSRIETGEALVTFTSASVADIVQGGADSCGHLAKAHGNKVEVLLDPHINIVVTDAVRLRQCVINLVSNACKFTHDGEIKVSARRVETGKIANLVIQVIDTGVGMSDETMTRLYQPFMRADSSSTRATGGMGMGLALTKRICEALGGRLEVSSALGKGTRCTISVPVAPAHLHANAQNAA